ncbi:MAG: hypothetical protein KAI76_06930 [Alphaproteobacteria bacterium]|nr:hypothetical protein [Alphaproteobacteria bacterium]
MNKVDFSKEELEEISNPVKSEILPVLSMMNALPDPVVCFNRDLMIRYNNHSARSFFRINDEQFLKKDMVELLGDENIVIKSVKTAVRENKSLTLHDVGVKGRPVSSVIILPVEINAWYLLMLHQRYMTLGDEWNEKTKYSIHDTQRKIHMMQYEIRNPLASILSAVQRLEKSKQISDEDRELTNGIGHEALKIQEGMKNLMILNEVQYRLYGSTNLHEILNRVIQMIHEKYGSDIKIEKKFDPSMPNIRGDFDTMIHAHMNIIKNAIEALPDKKGKISLRTFYDKAAGLNIEIEDNGRGIPPDKINHIFQPHFTTKTDGQGMGLPVASKIIDEHGGTINVKSEPGKTVFKINLPVLEDNF